MALWQHYHQPDTVEAAVDLLARYNGRSRIISGGTDLLLEMQQGHKPPVTALIDVTRIAQMGTIQQHQSWLEIGAAVTHTHIVQSALIQQQATCLIESCGVIGGPQVRNVATLGGNVAHALPAADGTTALVALQAEAEVAAANGRQWQPLLTLFKGPGQSAVDATQQLITRFRFAVGSTRTGTAFKRIMRPQGVALPILACAVWLQVSATDPSPARIEAACICIGPVRPVPCRAWAGEQALIGRDLDEGLEACVMAVQAEFQPRTSKHRATAAYRTEMIATLLRRTLPLAFHRATTGHIVPEGVGLQ